jgi:hypothetical protein
MRPSNPEGVREKIVRLELHIRYYSNYIKKFKVPILNDLCSTLKVSTVTNQFYALKGKKQASLLKELTSLDQDHP